MDANEFVLACLSTGNRELFSPVQVQKMFFLFDKEIPKETGGPFFNFIPYNYGPFDSKVYSILNELSYKGYVEIFNIKNWKEYKLTNLGQELGEKHLKELPELIKDYITDVVKFVRDLSFTDLVCTIYKHYPEMKENSVFRDKQ